MFQLPLEVDNYEPENDIKTVSLNLNRLLQQLSHGITPERTASSNANASSEKSASSVEKVMDIDLPMRDRILFPSSAPSEFPWSLPPIMTRSYLDRREFDYNYPIIPRYRDRALLRKMQIRSSELFPPDFPQWSAREFVPTVSQPDQSEGDRMLVYEGFSAELYYTYASALEKGLVPIVPMPYKDDDMKRVLIEKGVLTTEKADSMVCNNGRDSWRGPTEGKEDKKHEQEMSRIMNAN
jgi:hypothetical protein